MDASRKKEANPIQVPEGRLIIDFMFICFAVVVAVIIGKFLMANTAAEILSYFDDEKNVLTNALAISCLVFIVMYSVNFFYFSRYQIMVDLFSGCLSLYRNKFLRLGSRFPWLQNIFIKIEPSPITIYCAHLAFIYFLISILLILLCSAACFWCLGWNTSFTLVNIGVVAPYLCIAIWQEGYSMERVYGDIGYTFLHVGTVLSFTDYGQEIAYISINIGTAILLLCLMWYSVNVLQGREKPKRFVFGSF